MMTTLTAALSDKRSCLQCVHGIQSIWCILQEGHNSHILLHIEPSYYDSSLHHTKHCEDSLTLPFSPFFCSIHSQRKTQERLYLTVMVCLSMPSTMTHKKRFSDLTKLSPGFVLPSQTITNLCLKMNVSYHLTMPCVRVV